MVKQAMTLIYSIGIFVARWSLQLAGIHSVHRHVEDASIAPWLVTAMFTPALGALLLMAFSKAARENVMWWLDWRALGFAPYCILIPTLVAFAEIAIFTWRGWGRSAWFGFSTAGVQVSGGRWLLGGGEQNWPVFISNVILTATVYSLVGMVFGAAEELGWRGYLQEQLIQRFGLSMGIICLGLLWSFWHLPLLLAGYKLSGKSFIRRALTVSDPACGGVVRLGVADITHQKLLAR